MSEKILEIRGDDWMKGLSYQPTLQYGGIFRQASNFNPFQKVGVMATAVDPTRYGNATVTKTIKYFAGFQASGVPYLFGWADGGGTPALYKITLSDGTTSDVSASVTVTSSAARGAIVYAGYLIYARDTEIRASLLDLSTNVQILTTGVISAEHPLTIGADQNIYFPNGNFVGKINSAPAAGSPGAGLTATTGNDPKAFTIDGDMTIRHLVNDGRYLIIIADNAGASTTGRANCMVAYWDYTSATLTQRFDFSDISLIAGAFLDGLVYIFGKENLYVTNIATAPKAIMSFIGTSTFLSSGPTSTSMVATRGSSLFWGNTTNATIYGYGSLLPGQKKIFYSPLTGSGVLSALSMSGVNTNGLGMWIGNTTPELYGFGITSTASTSSISIAQIPLPVPFKFDYAKITTRLVLSSGKSVTFLINSQGGTLNVTGTSTFSFSADGAKQTHIFRPEPSSGFAGFVEEFSLITVTSNADLEKIEVWGTRGDPQSQLQ